MAKNVLLIGATGFVGSAILNELLLRGHKVTAVVRDPKKLTEKSGVESVEADVADVDTIAKLAEGKDAVISAYNPGWTNPDIEKLINENYPKILEAAKKAMDAGAAGAEVTVAAQAQALEDLNKRYAKSIPIGRLIANEIPDGGSILTQCWAELDIAMVLRAIREQNKDVKVFCAETRPYFQGARLTASCAVDMGFDVTVISDNMPAYTMKTKGIDLFTSAADVTTCDGYIVNKVGTFQIALACSYYGVPYIAAGNPNPAHPSIDSVVIEERDPELTLHAMDIKLTKPGVKGYYPAFDVTPPEFVTAIATDKGLFKPADLYKYFER